MRTFSVVTLGCKVNQYEGEQLSALLRSRGLSPAGPGREADLRVVHTCSVTTHAAARSRQLARAAGRDAAAGSRPKAGAARRLSLPQLLTSQPPAGPIDPTTPATPPAAGPPGSSRTRVVVTGCWATSDPADAAALPGVDAVIGHHQDVAAELDRLLGLWLSEPVESSSTSPSALGTRHEAHSAGPKHGEISGMTRRPRALSQPAWDAAPEPVGNEGWRKKAGSPAGALTEGITPSPSGIVNEKMGRESARGATSLPLLSQRQTGRQRAHLKVQDGCDAHCTYCIIPRLRPGLWSKPIDDAVEEAKRLVAAGHVELVLTGIFLGAYGRATALRRRQEPGPAPLAGLVDALCGRVPGLRRLRFSSLEPGDLTGELLAALSGRPQVVPHFHLPLQSGSDALLRRMNRQYTRDDYLRMLDRVRGAFERPALTTDVIVGFPGESDAEFRRTLEVVEAAGFIHVHAFPFSPRPGTAAARWTGQFVRGPVANQRIALLRERAAAHGLAFRRQFVGRTVEVLVEREKEAEGAARGDAGLRHGRSERYFAVHFDDPSARPGDFVRLRVESVSPERTVGVRVKDDPVTR